jgi:hypothetical protein
VIETGRKIIGAGRYGQEGTGRVQQAWVLDPDRVRNFRAGQAAWVHGNACAYVQVARRRRSPLALPAGARAAEPRQARAQAVPGAGPGPGRPAVPGPEIPLPGAAS